jgi:hypothetical protein
MNKERNWLPWILGGLSATAVAVAFTAISTNRTASSNVPPAPLVASQPLASPPSPTPAAAAPEPAPVSAALPEPDPAQVPAPAPMQAAVEPEAPSGQIWVCTTKGVKTFSNNPCGEKSTLLDVGPINTMNATPLNRNPRRYEPEPRYAPAYNDQAPAPDDYSDQTGSDTGANSYTIVQGLAFVPRRHAEHHHRPPYHHNSAPAPRKF